MVRAKFIAAFEHALSQPLPVSPEKVERLNRDPRMLTLAWLANTALQHLVSNWEISSLKGHSLPLDETTKKTRGITDEAFKTANRLRGKSLCFEVVTMPFEHATNQYRLNGFFNRQHMSRQWPFNIGVHGYASADGERNDAAIVTLEGMLSADKSIKLATLRYAGEEGAIEENDFDGLLVAGVEVPTLPRFPKYHYITEPAGPASSDAKELRRLFEGLLSDA